ncbi:MAG: carboxypeptidase [Litorilituus sp.]|jgi:carboxypeptidase C (cathepsin A)|nr:carboxypeptidase [Litorilituus sp.]
MKIITLFSNLLWIVSVLLAWQVQAENERKLVVDALQTSKHVTQINGKKVKYTATTGTQPVWDKEGHPTASLFYTYYQRSDVENHAKRPLLISFNGGPGSASVWMHVAYTGPKVINVDDEGYPLQPYGVKINDYSILDKADIVFVNPVNTGYSRVLPNKEGKIPTKDQQKKMFFGVNADINYLAEWITTFVSRNNRWRSPKYLIGESYGTTRVSGLALALQQQQWMYINGVILVSPTDIGIKRDGPVKIANRLPYFAAAAWYHQALSSDLQQQELTELLAEVEKFTVNTYLPALAKGGFISTPQKMDIARKVSKYSGLSTEDILANNLDINNNFFWKTLLKDRKQTIGRLDSRYLGIDKKVAGSRPDYNAELTSWLHSFTPAINYYLREELNYKTDIKYNMFGDVHPWDRTNNKTGENLRLAMAQNPYLNVMIQSGYFDGATNYFDAKYTMWQLDPSSQMRDRLSFKGYHSGHMMYLRKEDLQQANEDIRDFINKTLPSENQAAKY